MFAPRQKVVVVAPVDGSQLAHHWIPNIYSKALNVVHEINDEYIQNWYRLIPGVPGYGFHVSWLRPEKSVNVAKGCSCPLKQLMNRGCKCGGA